MIDHAGRLNVAKVPHPWFGRQKPWARRQSPATRASAVDESIGPLNSEAESHVMSQGTGDATRTPQSQRRGAQDVGSPSSRRRRSSPSPSAIPDAQYREHPRPRTASQRLPSQSRGRSQDRRPASQGTRTDTSTAPVPRQRSSPPREGKQRAATPASRSPSQGRYRQISIGDSAETRTAASKQPASRDPRASRLAAGRRNDSSTMIEVTSTARESRQDSPSKVPGTSAQGGGSSHRSPTPIRRLSTRSPHGASSAAPKATSSTNKGKKRAETPI